MSNINSRMGAAEIIERLNQAKSTLDVSDSRINHLVSIMDELIDRLNCKEKNDTLYILIKPKAQISHLKWMTEKKFQDAVNKKKRRRFILHKEIFPGEQYPGQMKERKKRDKQIYNERLCHGATYKELGSKYGLTASRIGVIVHKQRRLAAKKVLTEEVVQLAKRIENSRRRSAKLRENVEARQRQ